MTSTTFFIIFIPILAILLLSINLVLAPHNPYQEKDSVFECGFHSFLGQNRTQFSVSFFIFGLLFLLFDLEILLVYPYSVSSYTNDIYGLVVMMVFFVLLTLGFIFELGKNALTIDSRQTSSNYGDISKSNGYFSGLSALENNSSASNSETTDGEVRFYVGIGDEEDLTLVPVIIREVENFYPDLEKKVIKCNPLSLVDNNEEYSRLAIEKAKLMYKKSEFCNCSFKG